MYKYILIRELICDYYPIPSCRQNKNGLETSIILLKNKISNRVFGCINHIAIVNLIESCFNLSGRTQALAQSSNEGFSRSAFQLPYLW